MKQQCRCSAASPDKRRAASSIFKFVIAICIGLISFNFPFQAVAQAVFGSIIGTVTDSSGAVVPNATVTVTDVSKGTSQQVKTNESGNYAVNRLIPDTYKIAVEAQNLLAVSLEGAVG